MLRAVIATIARRALHEVSSRHLHIGDLHIDTAARSVAVHGTPVKISRREFDLLCQLASDPTRVFTKTELLHTIWRRTDAGTRVVDSHASHLRARLHDAGATGYVKNVWGTGYVLSPEEQAR